MAVDLDWEESMSESAMSRARRDAAGMQPGTWPPLGHNPAPPADARTPCRVFPEKHAAVDLRGAPCELPTRGLAAVEHAMAVGAMKRPGRCEEWKTVSPVSHMASLLRHLSAMQRGEARDPDGQLHSAAVAFRAMAIAEAEVLAGK